MIPAYVDYLATAQSYRWLASYWWAVQRFVVAHDQYRQHLFQKLYDFHLRPLFNATPSERREAYKKFDSAFRRDRRMRELRIQQWVLESRYRFGAKVEAAWRWFRDGQIKLFDFTIFCLLGVTLITVVGWSLLTIFDFAANSRMSEAGEVSDSRPNAHADAHALRSAAPAADDSVLMYPNDGRPHYWAKGSAKVLLQGFDARPASISSLQHAADWCSPSTLVIFGTASLEGTVTQNRSLARRRAIAIMKQIEDARLGCGSHTEPPMLAVAMYLPIASDGDGSQRKAFVVALPAKSTFAKPSEAQSLLVQAEAALDGGSTELPSRYIRTEVCASDCQGENWVPFSASSQ
ncbi:MAG: hypothetical protein QM773_05520 [Hyphomonadaceae bacterium]